MDDINDGEGIFEHFPYYLLVTSCAVLLNKNVAIACLWAAYAIGMLDKLKIHYLFNLKGIFESILILIVGFFVFGFKTFLYYIILMLFINLSDDLLDYKIDEFGKNLARKFGFVEVGIVALNFLLLLFYLDYQYAFMSVIAYSIIQTYFIYRGRLYVRKDNYNLYKR
jgi:hypothetical protein